MGYTNKTSHYDLPQWIAGDKPSWLGDVNTAMLNIDTAIAGADASASAAESSAAAANAQVQAQEAKITKNTTDIQALTEQVADVSGVANGALPKNGGTMTGALTLAGAPTQDLQAATKKYVDENSGKGALMLTGGTMTGPLTLSGAPESDLQAATKKYVDEHSGSMGARTISENGLTNYKDGGASGNMWWNSMLAFISAQFNVNATITNGIAVGTQTFIPVAILNGDNPLNLATIASPATTSDFYNTGLEGIDKTEGSTGTAVIFATYNGTGTIFYIRVATSALDTMKSKKFMLFGGIAVM